MMSSKTTGAIVLSFAVWSQACGGAEQNRDVSFATPGSPDAQRYVGCVSPAAGEGRFVLSVAEGRDFTADSPPGAVVPEKGELPGGVAAPIPPVTATSGTPGGGPTPTTKIVTYTLVTDGGTNLHELVGHTVEVVGTSGEEGLRISSIRDVAEHCK